MKVSYYDVKVTSVSPILIHRFAEAAEVASGKSTMRPKHREEEDPREQARKTAYVSPRGFLYAPTTYLMGTIVAGGKRHKKVGSRSSMKYDLAGTVLVLGPDDEDPEVIPFLDPQTGEVLGADAFEVDARPVTIPATKGKIMRYRARINAWSLAFRVRVMDDHMDWRMVKTILDESGIMTGIGDFRPEKTGPFGQFTVTKFEASSS